MCITTVSFIRYMTHEFCIKQPMQRIELKLNMVIDENPHLINALDRSVNHPSIRKYSSIPFQVSKPKGSNP